MAVTSGSRCQYEYMLGGGPPAIVEVGEKYDSTGWDKGTWLIKDSSGHVTKHATGNITGGVIGFAMQSMSSTADGSKKVPMLLVTPNTVFSAVCAHATTASAALQTANLFATYMLTSSATVCPSTNVHVIDLGTASTAAGAYIIAPKDATGTLYGRAYFILGGRTYSTDSPWNDNTST